MLYSAGVQHELLPGLSGSLNYYYRKYYRDFWVDNLATTHADYSIIPIADPRGNGETIPIYSIAPGKLGVIDNYRFNSTENGRQYHGIDFSMNSRFRNGTQLQGGITTGKLHEQTCQVDDPNQLRYCDAELPVPHPVQAEWHVSVAVRIPSERVVAEPARCAERA